MNTSQFSSILAAAVFANSTILIATPEMAPQSDQERADLINSFLAQSPKMEGASVQVSVSDHIAQVRGTVRTLDQAEWVVSTIYATDEVYGAVQDISFAIPEMDSAEVAEDASHMLGHAVVLEGSLLSATVNSGGQLTIEGEASSPDQLDAARELVSRIEGVTKVHLAAEINPMIPQSPRAIESYLSLRLQDDPLLIHTPVSFSFDADGLVLEGAVPSVELKERLVMSSMIGGVMSCNSDKLEVDPDLAIPGMSDKQYFPQDGAHALGLIMEKDSRIPSGQVSISVKHGHLLITGGKLSPSVAKALDDNCRSLPGVASVSHNYEVGGGSTLSQNAQR